MQKIPVTIGVLLLSSILAGCAGTQNRHTDPQNDPWEGFNRKVYAFNSGLDKAILRPVALAYDKLMPDPFQRGVSNFFTNLYAPVTVANELLQGKLKQSGISIGRFLVNSTIGLLGFFDVATDMGMPLYREDFGQTFAHWGYNKSRYLMLPIFGPSTIRDGIGRVGNSYLDPVSYVALKKNQYAPEIIRGIDLRARLLPQDEELENAYDAYVLLRDVWMQNRTYQIFDGDPPLTDYDTYLDDEQGEAETDSGP